jgi:hypothetical protein
MKSPVESLTILALHGHHVNNTWVQKSIGDCSNHTDAIAHEGATGTDLHLSASVVAEWTRAPLADAFGFSIFKIHA